MAKNNAFQNFIARVKKFMQPNRYKLFMHLKMAILHYFSLKFLIRSISFFMLLFVVGLLRFF